MYSVEFDFFIEICELLEIVVYIRGRFLKSQVKQKPSTILIRSLLEDHCITIIRF